MNNLLIKLIYVVVVVTLTACSNDEASKGDLILTYEDSEPGVDVFTTRLLVNDNFLRMDDGVDDSSYTLYDRQSKIIYSVSHENQSILKLSSKKSTDRITRELKMDAKKITDATMPKVQGKTPAHYQLTVNDKVCATVISVKGLHEKATNALNEFRRSLVSTHLKNLANTPDEMQDECFLAHNVLSPSRTLQFGLPIFEEDNNGVKRILVDYKDAVTTNASLYILPTDYRYINRGSN